MFLDKNTSYKINGVELIIGKYYDMEYNGECETKIIYGKLYNIDEYYNTITIIDSGRTNEYTISIKFITSIDKV